MTYPVTYSGLGAGDMVSYNILVHMASVVRQSAINFKIIQWARAIVQGCAWKDATCEIGSIYTYVQGHSRYVHDPYGEELVVTPPAALDMISRGEVFNGDCDDLTVLSLSLLRAIGYNVRIRAVSYTDDKVLRHVYGLVEYQPGLWMAIDEINPGGYPGWEKPGATKIQDWLV